MPQNLVLNWSSGKDAALAYHLLRKDNSYNVKELLTTINSEADRVFMHGTREKLLDMQAQQMALPLTKIKLPPAPDDAVYKEPMRAAMKRLALNGICHAAYGDIFLEDLRIYREALLSDEGFTGVFPLWKKDTRDLVATVEHTGIDAIIVCVNARVLGKEFLGRKINSALLHDLPAGVDPCGENGEYHTCVVNAPFFKSPIRYTLGEMVFKAYDASPNASWDNGFYFLDVIPE
jgi:uncharacterized protein (TIGR00290 family)